MKNNTLTLHPKDYLVTAGGLKIENTTDDMVMEVELPEKITVYPQENVKVDSSKF